MIHLPHLRETIALSVAMVTMLAAPLEAQIGGLIRRAAQRAAPDPTVPPPGAPDVYTEHLLELVPDVLDKVIAGKRAGSRFAAGPQGPANLQQQRDDVFVRAGDHYDRNQLAIQRGEELVDQQARCVDDALYAAKEKRNEEFGQRMMTDMSLQMKFAELSQKAAEAQQRGDTLAFQRLAAEVEAMNGLTAADSSRARSTCPMPTTAREHQQYVAMQAEIKSLDAKLAEAKAEVGRRERETSGLTGRQIAMACERINIFRDQSSARKGMKGFSAAELEALDQRKGDLDGLCTG